MVAAKLRRVCAGTSNRGASRWWIPALLGVVALGGLSLLFLGGSDDDPDNTDSPAGASLDLTDTDAESVSELAKLTLPSSTSDFLTARLDDDSQLDVTFTIDPADEAAFLDGSGLPAPVVDERVIFHSSPLWELNAEGTVRGSADTAESSDTSQGGVRRAVELVDEGESVRVRLVITPA
ncbi:MAG: hypothetical protein ACR2OH_08320 [Microthrixaceae bacterium]